MKLQVTLRDGSVKVVVKEGPEWKCDGEVIARGVIKNAKDAARKRWLVATMSEVLMRERAE